MSDVEPTRTRPVVLDTDPGIDDAVAIALAARLAALQVVAITTVHGNVEVERATRNARELARRAALDVPIIPGASRPLTRPARPARETHGLEGLGYYRPQGTVVAEPDRAAEEIVRLARATPALTLCCLGPLTNLARALELEPTLGSMLGPVFVMGGALHVRGTQTERSEFNWWSDPEAAQRVLGAELDVHLVPLDVTRRIAVPGSAIRALAEAGREDSAARFWAELLRFYADFHRSHERFDGCVINDALAVALAADASLATWREERIRVSTSDDSLRGALSRDDRGARVRVAVDVRAEEVLELVGREVFAQWLTADALHPGARDASRWLEENALPGPPR
jgi:purine nucleosidase